MDPITLILGIVTTLLNTNQATAPWVRSLKGVFQKAKDEGRTELTATEMAQVQKMQDDAVAGWDNRPNKRT